MLTERPRVRHVRSPGARDGDAEAGRISRGAAHAIVWLRWPIVAGWIAAAAAAWLYLPGTGSLPSAGIFALIPTHTRAFHAIDEETALFGSHLIPQIAVVQRPGGRLGLRQQAAIVREAVRLDEGRLPGFPRGSLAVPLVNTLPFVAGAHETSTTAVTYLAFPSRLSSPQQNRLAQRYAKRLTAASGAQANVTGLIPGALGEASAIGASLRWIEIATILMLVLIIGLYLRSVLAPVVTVLAAGILYFLSTRAVTWITTHLGVPLHQGAEPIVAVLLLGVITDYAVFFLSGMRDRMLGGAHRLEAARGTTARFLPIVFTAGLLVASGLSTLQVASVGFVRALGPGMAIVVVLTLLVALTFVPAAMAVLGRVLFWPGIRGAASRRPDGTGESARGRGRRNRIARLVSRRGPAWIAATGVALLLGGLGSGILFTRLGVTPIRGLPPNSGPHRAEAEAAQGFAAGIVSPTDVMVQAPGVARRQLALTRLGRLMRGVPGVAAVAGAGVPGIPKRYDVFHARSAGAARFLVVFDHAPFSAPAIDDLLRLQARMPRLLAAAGLPRGATTYSAGDTAIARDTVDMIYHDLELVAGTVFAVNLLLLVLFLRALVAPLYLIASSALTLAATFGLSTYVWQGVFGYPSLTYVVPLAGGVLLVAFGSDYNLFVVGRIWQESEERSAREAIRAAVPRASRAISVAGLALAFSFAMLAIVPLRSFRELALAVGAGVLIDTFLVRTLLVPSLVTIVGRRSWWPSSRGR